MSNLVNRNNYNVIEAKRAFVRAELATSYFNDEVPYTTEQLEKDVDAVIEAEGKVDYVDITLQDLIYAAEVFFEDATPFDAQMLINEVHSSKYR